jgi:hypothetical protein
MKVYLNLADPRDRRERYSLLWAVPTLVLSIIVLVWLATTAIYGLRRSHQIQRSLAEVKTRDAALWARETQLKQQIEQPRFQQMIEKTEFVNQLIGQKQFSLTELTFEVSKLLPPAARLNGLALASSSVPNPEVQFAVMGKNEEAIESFLDNLEGSHEFSDVIIKSQGFRGGNGSSPQEVALVCTAKYVPPIPSPGN